MFTRMFEVYQGDLGEKKKTKVTWESDVLIESYPKVREVPDVKRTAACPVSASEFSNILADYFHSSAASVYLLQGIDRDSGYWRLEWGSPTRTWSPHVMVPTSPGS